MFTEEQIEFMKKNGLNLDFDNLSDDDYIKIEEEVGDILQINGFNYDYSINECGKMCESILDNIDEE